MTNQDLATAQRFGKRPREVGPILFYSCDVDMDFAGVKYYATYGRFLIVYMLALAKADTIPPKDAKM